MNRISVLLAGAALGAIATGVTIGFSDGLRSQLAAWSGINSTEPAHGHREDAHRNESEHQHDHDNDQIVKLSDRQVAAASIEIAPAEAGTLVRRLSVPGSIVPSGDNIARVAVKLLGTVAELRKRLGEPVQQHEVVAVIESREVADAKSEYLAARLTHNLQEILAGRARTLMESRNMAENEYLRTRNAFEDAKVKLSTARQKLSALGLTDQQVNELPDVPVETLRRQELRAPIAGRIAERRVDLGALVGREGQESELFVIVNLDTVWIELAVPSFELELIREGQDISVTTGATRASTPAKITFISPLLDKETRAARVVATLDNPTHAWRPGTFVTAEIPLEQQQATVVIPKTALQTVKAERVVFVRRDDGFEARKVTTGREDDRAIEVTSGLEAGERVAITNTFVLKAELGKAEAAHED
jgi:membrane fusion protein, heavy metal efflux system